MATTTRRRLDSRVPWTIYRDGYRRAKLGGLLLIVSNGRRGGWGPVHWAVFSNAGRVASGEVWQGTEYVALVRQAMLEAETAASCDDCGRVICDASAEH